MTYPAIRVENVSKIYPLYDHPSDRFKEALYPWRKKYHRDFSALKHVSFEIPKGQTVGVIGKNGSGKSTLLKILSGVLTPSSGVCHTRGRVASLLELGTGFNPELTGIENIYFNATLLGFSKKETDAKLDDILSFADIGSFIDQPVKIYSGGMTVRLAFAVMAHVDAEILIIDEALAVGDVFFVQKCMRFLRRFMDRGTLLFASHDTGAVTHLCQAALWLDKGDLKMFGGTKKVIDAYLQANLQDLQEAQVSIHENHRHSDGWNTGAVEIESVRLLGAEGKPLQALVGGEFVCLVIQARADREVESPIIGFLVKDRLGQALFGENTFAYTDPPLHLFPGQTCEARFYFKLPLLPNGDYTVTVAVAEGTVMTHVQHRWIHEAFVFKVASNRLRDGLVGIEFESVTMSVLEKIET